MYIHINIYIYIYTYIFIIYLLYLYKKSKIVSTKTTELSCLFSERLLKSQRLKETLKNSFWSSTSILWSTNSSNTQKYKEIQIKL